ncbi:hypothetical protein GALMADRAFT_1259048 [Galerina marginata CBS 339.88]|uniref:Secreted protein n=1 Tax=Galerina marginata (strain CBS 339.88) TaxID=685588 RepID=A0A067T611_GALM3|nr:hypothetical protein GALMADRAFT_1259048 [Galerina marginata CBS 339.88]
MFWPTKLISKLCFIILAFFNALSSRRQFRIVGASVWRANHLKFLELACSAFVWILNDAGHPHLPTLIKCPQCADGKNVNAFTVNQRLLQRVMLCVWIVIAESRPKTTCQVKQSVS